MTPIANETGPEVGPGPPNGQTGSVGKPAPYVTAVGCTATATELDPSADSALGFDAQTVIDLVSGEHRAELVWTPSTFVRSPALGAEVSHSQISVGIEVLGPPQLLQRGPGDAVPSDAPPWAGRGDTCRSAIGLPVRVHLHTDDGAIDQAADTTIEAEFADFARAVLAFPADTLTGAYHPVSAFPDAYGTLEPQMQLYVELTITPAGLMGSVGAQSQAIQPDGTPGTYGDTIGHFPVTMCGNLNNIVPVPRAQSLRGVSLDGTLAQLNAASPLQATSLDGGSSPHLSIEVESSQSELCLSLESDSSSDTVSAFDATVRLSADDGSVDGAFPVLIRLEGFPTPTTITAVAGTIGALIDTAPEAARRFGIQQVIDFSDYGGTDTDFWLQIVDGKPRGALEVWGWHLTPCGGVDPTALCKGNDRTVIWSLAWGNGPS